MYYIVQENLFKEKHYHTLIELLKRYKLDYETIPFRPFTNTLDFKTDRKDVFCFGSVNMSKVALQYGWNPGSFHNSNHDIEIYGSYYGHNMLNHDGYIIKFGDPLPEKIPRLFFSRPAEDTKSYSGGIFTREHWEEFTKPVVLEDSNVIQNLSADTKIFVAPLKNIQQEIRVWIVDGEPITISQYKIGSRVNYLNMDHNEEAYYFAKQMAKLFCPARAFVLDICLSEDEYKVVEINCINCAGFYDLDMSKLLQSLEKSFNNAY